MKRCVRVPYVPEDGSSGNQVFDQDRRWRAGWEVTPLLTVVQEDDGSDNSGASRSVLDEIARDGARQMLAAALEAEVAADVGQFAGQVDGDGRRLVVRNGYHRQREVLTAAGAVSVAAPRVNDRRMDPDTGVRHRFSSAVLPAWARKSLRMAEDLATGDS